MELLSPVKNLEYAKIAIKAGAQGIYLSSNYFGARQAATIEHEVLAEIVDYAKIHRIKTYITLNTLVFNQELGLFIEEIDYLANLGVTGIIVQDYSFIALVKKRYPTLEVHCSTQMHVHNTFGAEWVHALGADQVVLPREMTLKQVEHMIEKTGIKTEVFVHGALCTSYSGQCLISSFSQETSGNRGSCSQLCRMPMGLFVDGEKKEQGKYLLSLKDLNIHKHIEDLVKIGVYAFKIEGRLKEYTYLAATTFVYRNLLEGKRVDPEVFSDTFNRGFTLGNLFSEENMGNVSRVNNHGVYIGKVVKETKGWIYVEAHKPLLHLDKIRLIGETETGQTIDVIEKIDETVYKIKSSLKNLKGASVYRVSSHGLVTDIKQDNYNYYDRNKEQIQLKVSMALNQPIAVQVQGVNEIFYSKENLAPAVNRPMEKEKILTQLGKTKDYPFDFSITLAYVAGFLSIKGLNELRRDIYEFIKTERLAFKHEKKDAIQIKSYNQPVEKPTWYIEISNKKGFEAFDLDLEEVGADGVELVIVTAESAVLTYGKEKGYTCFKKLPHVMEEADFQEVMKDISLYDGVVVSELGSLAYLKSYEKPIISYYTFNTSNYYNQQFLNSQGIDKTLVSQEVPYGDMDGFDFSKAIFFLYGTIPLMVMKHCPIIGQNCNGCRKCLKKNYEIQINGELYGVRYLQKNKVGIYGSRPIYNKALLEKKLNYYMVLDEKNTLADILGNRIYQYKEYMKKTKA